MYYVGQGVSQDYAEAAQWFRRAAEQGNANAQLKLGIMHFLGKGVPQDYTKTAQWYRRAAEQGEVNAQYHLGLMYNKGTGVTRNPVMAYVVSNLAAAQGNKKAREIRDIIAKTLSREQIAEGQRMASEWRVGTPLPYFKDFKTWP
jgi:TPR repeat protein